MKTKIYIIIAIAMIAFLQGCKEETIIPAPVTPYTFTIMIVDEDNNNLLVGKDADRIIKATSIMFNNKVQSVASQEPADSYPNCCPFIATPRYGKAICYGVLDMYWHEYEATLVISIGKEIHTVKGTYIEESRTCDILLDGEPYYMPYPDMPVKIIYSK